MKLSRRILAGVVSLFTAVLVSDALAAGEGPGGGGPAQLLQRYRDQVQTYRVQVDEILATASAEFDALVKDPDKSFEELRQLAELRLQLLRESEAAQAVMAELDAFQQQFRQEHPELFQGEPGPGPGPGMPPAPELTDAQKQALQQFREQLQAKEQELNQILAQLSERYAELVAKQGKTPAEIREMFQLRHELITGSPEAQAIVDAMQGMVEGFHEQYPVLARLTHPVWGKATARYLKANLQAMRALNEEIDELLAAASEEYAALLAKEDKTAADMARLRELREQLIAGTPEAQQLAQSIQVLKNRLHVGRRPDRPDRPRPPRPDLPGNTGGTTGGTETADPAGE